MTGTNGVGSTNQAAVLAIALVLSAAGLTATASDQDIGDTTVFAEIGEPGSPEGIYVDGDRVFVGTHTPVYGNENTGPSHVFVYDKDTTELVGDIEIEGQNTEETHGLLGMAMDDEGRLYVVDRNPPRLVRLTIDETEQGEVVATDQETYATFPDLPACTPEPVGPQGHCSPNAADLAPFPDYVAFAPNGDAYLTDLEQAVIFRVPAGGEPAGHEAQVWYADARFDSLFATNGIALDPDGERLVFAMTGHQWPALEPAPVLPTQGVIYALPLQEATPEAEDLEAVHVYDEPAAGPDGLAYGATGNLYVALAGASQLSILDEDGQEIERFPGTVENQRQEIPYDLPASVAFDGEGSLLVTNQAFFTGDEHRWAVLEAYVDDTAHPVEEPSIAS